MVGRERFVRRGVDMATQILHDPFARVSLMREKCSAGLTCKWCGQAARWSYYYSSDAIYLSPHRYGSLKTFCSVGCYRIYNGLS